MGWSRWFFKATAGVEDFVQGADDDEISSRRNYVYWTIEHSSFQGWVVFVAGVGFFTDAYDLFALNVVLPILDIVYWEGKIPDSYENALICATLAGTSIGQVLFGFLADRYGRRKMYGLELLIVISATLGVAMSATGEKRSMSIMGWLIFWRIMMGIGIGADYPLSAVICSEFAPRKQRARMLASVFACQPIGQLLGMVVSLVVITASREWISVEGKTCTTDECIRVLDSAWRWIVGFGSVPAMVALFFRLTIPESPHYLLDVVGAVKSASQDTQNYYNAEAFGESHELMEAGRNSRDYSIVGSQHPKSSTQGTPSVTPIIRPVGDEALGYVSTDSHSMGAPGPAEQPPFLMLAPVHHDMDSHQSGPVSMHSGLVSPSPRAEDAAAEYEQPPPKASWQDARQFFIEEKNWIYLAETSSSWFLLDFAFYGLGLSAPAISRNIFHNPNDQSAKVVYQILRDNTLQSLVLVSLGTMVGSLIIIKVIKYCSTKTIQFYGFVALTILFLTIGGAFSKLLDSDYKGIIIALYVLCQLSFNLGPNTTTFIIPAEIFPTRYRCTCHGISAAAGKLGSIVGQLFIAHVRFPGLKPDDQGPLGWILMILALFMALGAAVTRFLLPETRDEKGESRSLQVLAKGRTLLKAWERGSASESRIS